MQTPPWSQVVGTPALMVRPLLFSEKRKLWKTNKRSCLRTLSQSIREVFRFRCFFMFHHSCTGTLISGVGEGAVKGIWPTF